MRAWTIWNWISYTCLWIAAVALALEGATKYSPTLMKIMPEFVSGPIWPFVPLFFLFLATVVFLVRELFDNRDVQPRSSNITGKGAGLQAGTGSITLPAIHQPIVTKERRFVGESITPEYLGTFFEQHTAIQAAKLTEVYIGKWMSVSGAVGEIHPSSPSFDNYAFVQFIYDPKTRITVGMSFSKDWLDRLAPLRRGDRINVIGEIKSVSPSVLILDRCELVD